MLKKLQRKILVRVSDILAIMVALATLSFCLGIWVGGNVTEDNIEAEASALPQSLDATTIETEPLTEDPL